MIAMVFWKNETGDSLEGPSFSMFSLFEKKFDNFQNNSMG